MAALLEESAFEEHARKGLSGERPAAESKQTHLVVVVWLVVIH